MMELNRELIDSLENRIGRRRQRLPFGAFDIYLDDETTASILVLHKLLCERVEDAAVLIDSAFAAEAFRVEKRPPSGTDRSPSVEAVVLMHGSVQPA